MQQFFQDGDVMGQILVKLGELGSSFGQLREDFNDEKTAARDNRATLHRRMDDQARDIADIKTDVALSLQAVGDISKKQDEVAKTQSTVIMPAVAEWQDMKKTGVRIVGLLALGGVTVGAAATWFSDQAVTVVRHWLRIH